MFQAISSIHTGTSVLWFKLNKSTFKAKKKSHKNTFIIYKNCGKEKITFNFQNFDMRIHTFLFFSCDN